MATAKPANALEKFDALLEHEHLLGKRIFEIGRRLAQAYRKLTDGKPPTLERTAISSDVFQASGLFVHLIDRFADQVHLRAEEAMVSFAIARGMPPEHAQWMLNQHDQARAYWAGIDVAWRRICFGDAMDRYYAAIDFSVLTAGFVVLFDAHAVREEGELYQEAASHFSPEDDDLVTNIIEHSGPSDITPYIGMVDRAEKLLGIPPTPA